MKSTRRILYEFGFNIVCLLQVITCA